MNAKDAAFKAVTRLHIAIFRATKGRALGRFFGMPALVLTTTGRKTGARRSSILTAPIREDHRLVLVASYGGDDRHPAWLHNVRANPEVEVTMDGRTRRMRARVATPQEKSELWGAVVDNYKGYGAYQRRTDRDIPLVIVEG